MFLGALIDAEPAVADLLEKTVREFKLGARLEISPVMRSGIRATRVEVKVEPAHHASDGHAHHRGLKQIREIIGGAAISERAKETAVKIFSALGEVEAKIHGIPVEQIHFHEVGAVDAIVDVVCAAVGAEALGVDEWVCSPLNVGGGAVQCDHGRFPVPAPATVALLRGAPVYSSGIEAELVTPTGAAVAATLAARFGAFPAMKITGSGYGAGSHDFPGHANVLRITLGEAERSDVPAERIVVLETNLDDLSPQVFAYVMEKALSEGALEAFGTPVQMKKNRSGMLLTVLAKPQDASRLERMIFAETSTLGVRRHEENRQALPRRHVAVATPWGEVRMKVGTLDGVVTNYAPEYEDCRRLAAEHHIPLKTIMQEAVRAYLAGEKDQHG